MITQSLRPGKRRLRLAPSSNHLRDGFFLLVRLSTVSGPFQVRLASSSYPGCPEIGQCLPALHLLQLSEGGLSTTFWRRPYFLRGMSWCSEGGT